MDEERIKRDYFGFLPWKWALEFEGGKILPHPEFEETAAWLDKYTHEDGFLYPPIEHRRVVDPITIKPLRKIPKTKRPAHLYQIPPSHEISLSDLDILKDIRKGPGSFLINLLAYLFGVRLQFHDWWVDGRLPILEKARTHKISFTKDTAEHFLSHCYKIWEAWHEKEQKLITNLLFMHSRAPSYEWDWERFFIEYMVSDGCYKLAKSLGVVKKSHLMVSESKFFAKLLKFLSMTTLSKKSYDFEMTYSMKLFGIVLSRVLL
jgi:hypothetical protein